MRYIINIDTENDAFQPDWQDEVNRLLLVVVKRIENDEPTGDLRDVNGNLCGSHGLHTATATEKLVESLEDLLATTELNLDDLENHTQKSIEEARKVLAEVEGDMTFVNGHAKYRDPREAFRLAIEKGVLSDDSEKENFAGNYRYMGEAHEGGAMFKNIETGFYLPACKLEDI